MKERVKVVLAGAIVLLVLAVRTCGDDDEKTPLRPPVDSQPVFESVTAEELCIRMAGDDPNISEDEQLDGRKESGRLKNQKLRIVGTVNGKPYVSFGGHPMLVLEGMTYLAGTACRVDLSFPEGDPEVESKVMSVYPRNEVTAECIYEKGSFRGVYLQRCKLMMIGSSRVE